MTQTKTTSTAAAWIGPIAAFALLIGGGWFLVWYWHGVDTSGTIMLSPETTAALMSGTPGAASPPVAVIPPLDIPDKGSIVQSGVGNSWEVNTGPYKMRVEHSDAAANYQFTFSARRNEVFHGADLKLVALAVQLMFNPPVQHQSGVSPDVVQQLRDTFGRKLNNPELAVADADIQTIANLWGQYLAAASGSTQQDAGAKLLDAVTDISSKALAQNQGQYADTIKSLRQIIPTDMEKTYRDNIKKASQPTT